MQERLLAKVVSDVILPRMTYNPEKGLTSLLINTAAAPSLWADAVFYCMLVII